VAITLNGISHIVTLDLSRDLYPELIGMLNHSRAHMRKRAILALYKVFVKYPEAAQSGMSRLKDKLEDSDPGMPCIPLLTLMSNRFKVSLLRLLTFCVNWRGAILGTISFWLRNYSTCLLPHLIIGCS
jgi:hypothetical protein